MKKKSKDNQESLHYTHVIGSKDLIFFMHLHVKGLYIFFCSAEQHY